MKDSKAAYPKESLLSAAPSSNSNNPQCIPIATVTSNTYLRQTLIMIWSVALSSVSNSFFHFYLIHNSLGQDEQSWMIEHTRMLDSCEVSFVDIREWQQRCELGEYEWAGKIPCFSLFCPYLFPETEKMLVLDGDLVVHRDVTELFYTDLGAAYLGAVYDLDFIGQWKRGNREYHRYYTQQVPLPNPLGYVQSGVLLMNLRAIRESFPPLFFYKVAREKKFRYDDQDILNFYCAGHILKLDYRWNVIHDNNHYRIRYVMQFAPQKEFRSYLESRESPYIIHYAGDEKPWISKNCDLYHYYWDVVQHTPYAHEFREPLESARQPLKLVLKKYLHEAIRFVNCIKAHFTEDG